VKKYVCGYFGELPLPVEPDVKDRIIQNGSRDVALTPPPLEPVVPGLRKRYPTLDDDGELLRYMYGDEKIDGLAPTGNGDEFSVRNPLSDLVAGLGRIRRRVQVTGATFGART
jgi:oxaloacetate decarboxylase alpha subunit